MPISDIALARDAIISLFKTAWEAQTPPVPTLFFEDIHFDRQDTNTVWARIIVRHTTGFQATLSTGSGNRRFRRLGLVNVEIYTPPGSGLTEADKFAKVALDAFEGNSTALDAVVFRNVRVNELGQTGQWYQTNVICEFDYDEVK